MSDFLMKPKIDFAFKEIMEDAKARTGFLSAVLHLDPESIRETRILNSNLRKMYEDDKLDIKSAYGQLQVISQDKQKRLKYTAREKAIRDHNQSMYGSKQEGIEIGEKRGIERVCKLMI